jgi:hypothetical protein
MLKSRAGHSWQYGACALHDVHLRLQIHTHTHTHTSCVILNAFPLEQWLHEGGCYVICALSILLLPALDLRRTNGLQLNLRCWLAHNKRNSEGEAVFFKCLLCETKKGAKISEGFGVQEQKLNDSKRISFFLSGFVLIRSGGQYWMNAFEKMYWRIWCGLRLSWIYIWYNILYDILWYMIYIWYMIRWYMMYFMIYDTWYDIWYIWHGPPLWSSSQSFWLQKQRSRVRFPALPDFFSSGSGTGSTQPREVNWGATWIK